MRQMNLDGCVTSLPNCFEENGLTIEALEGLSIKTEQDKSLKNILRHFDERQLKTEIISVLGKLGTIIASCSIYCDYRVKSKSSAFLKFDRYKDSDRHVNQIFNDLIGFRALCDDYAELLDIKNPSLHIADLSRGKSVDDGYRGVHEYFYVDNFHYPVEVQFNTLYDRQLNNWLHNFLYKNNRYSSAIGAKIKVAYDSGEIHSSKDFLEVLKCLAVF